MKKKSIKLIIPSLLAIAGCLSISVGTTYSLFTSESTNNITISSGKVSVKSEISDVTTWSLKDGIQTQNEGTSFETGGEANLENGKLTLSNIVPGDKVSFKVTIKNEATISAKYRTSFLYSNDTGLFGGLKITVNDGSSDIHNNIYSDSWNTLSNETKTLTISVELPEDATNVYQNKSCELNFKVEAIQANGDIKNDTVIYNSLEEFNNSTLDDDVKNVYLFTGNKDIEETSDLVIGKDEFLDSRFTFNYNGSETFNAGDKVTIHNKEYVVTKKDESSNLYWASTGHTAKNLYIIGNFNFKTEGSNDINTDTYGKIKFKLPDNSNIYFSSSTFSNYMRFGIGGDQPSVSMESDGNFANITNSATGVSYSSLNSVNFSGVTFDGIWHQGGGKIYCNNINFDNVTFNDYKNSKKANDSNPIWIQGPQTTSISVTNSTINSSRPLKFIEGNASGTYNISNNIFNMDQSNNKDGKKYKDMGIYIDGVAGENKTCTLNGNITIKDNILKNGTSLMAFNDDRTTFNIASGASFTQSGNKDGNNTQLSGVRLAAVWKSNSEAMTINSSSITRAS